MSFREGKFPPILISSKYLEYKQDYYNYGKTIR